MRARPEIDAVALASVVADYPQLGVFKRILKNGLSVNTAACLFETAEGTYFAKRYADANADLKVAHALTLHLQASDYPTPRLHRNHQSETIHHATGASYALYDRARGEDRYGDHHVFAPFDSLDEAVSAGTLLARYHLSLASFGAPVRPFKGLVSRFQLLRSPWIDAALEALWKQAPALGNFVMAQAEWEFLKARMIGLGDCLAPLLKACPEGLIHGDFIKRNLFFEGLRVSAVVDFDLWNHDFLVFDLALALLPCGFDWPEILAGRATVNRENMQAFLRGYTRVRHLEPAEARGLAVMIEAARVEFYLSAVAAALEVGQLAEAERFWRILADTQAWFERNSSWRVDLLSGRD